MTDLTLLDQSVAALSAAKGDDAMLRAFYDRLSGSDLFLLLEAEANGDQVTPQTLVAQDQTFVLVFDTAQRLAEFAGQAAPFAQLPGKDLCLLLAPNGLGIALNPEVSARSYLMSADDVHWVAENLSASAAPVEAKLIGLRAPHSVPQDFQTALEHRLAGCEGAAQQAVIVRAHYEDQTERVLVGVIDAPPEWHHILTAHVQDAVALIMPQETVDVGFFAHTDPIAAALRRNGVAIDLPQAPSYAPTAPGMDPDKPPRL